MRPSPNSQTLLHLFLVGSGGFLGSIARYLVYRLLPMAGFPWGTLAVNVTGCLLIGLLAGLADLHQVLRTEGRLFLLVGCLGGFTTFSSFGNETFLLMRDGEILKALANVALQLSAGLLAVWLGHTLARIW